MNRKIDKVTIKGFKSLREIIDLELKMVNIIVGANGAGKSNFIQLFRMIQAMLKKNFQSYITEHGGADAFLYNGRKVTKEIFAEFKFGDNSYRFSLLPTSNENFSISEYRRYSNCNWNVNGVGLLESLLQDYKDEGSSVYLGAKGIGFYIYKAISQWMVYHFHDTGDSAPMRLSEIVEDNVYLRDDAADPASSNDFGKNIIPNMLAAKEKMFAYSFEGYWKDVGTISSLWEANMDMLGTNPAINLNDESWRIFSRHENEAPQYVGADATVVNSSVTEGCEIYGEVVNSVLGAGVKVEKGAVVRDAVIMGGVRIGENAKVEYSIIDSNVTVGNNASVGKSKDVAKGITVVGMGLNIPDGKVIGDDEMVTNI